MNDQKSSPFILAGSIAMLGLVGRIILGALDNALFGWIDETFAEVFGVTSPTIDQVIWLSVNWLLPLGFAA